MKKFIMFMAICLCGVMYFELVACSGDKAQAKTTEVKEVKSQMEQDFDEYFTLLIEMDKYDKEHPIKPITEDMTQEQQRKELDNGFEYFRKYYDRYCKLHNKIREYKNADFSGSKKMIAIGKYMKLISERDDIAWNDLFCTDKDKLAKTHKQLEYFDKYKLEPCRKDIIEKYYN